MPTDAEILSVLRREKDMGATGVSTWYLAYQLRASCPGLPTRALRARLEALCADGAVAVVARRANMILWEIAGAAST